MELSSGSARLPSPYVQIDFQGKRLPAEIDHEGNVEYKLQLVDPTPERFEHLVTQLNWRLSEGGGEALYELGVSDSGLVLGLSEENLAASMATLQRMTERVGADSWIVRQHHVSAGGSARKSVELVVRKRATSGAFDKFEVHVAMLGGHDAGKSTLLGVLTQGNLDNGRGRARLNLLRHRHEIETGRTSSISYELLGFSALNEPINYGTPYVVSWSDILARSHRIVSFVDTCGHPSYQHTTLRSLLPRPPDYAFLVLPATSGGVSAVGREHFLVSVGVLSLPTIVVVTKIDKASTAQLRATLEDFLSIWKEEGRGSCRLPFVVNEEEDVTKAVEGLVDGSLIPIFLTSSVTGERLSLLQALLGQLPKPPASTGHRKQFSPLLSGHDRRCSPVDVNPASLTERLVAADLTLPVGEYTADLGATEGEEFAAFQIEDVYSVPGVGDVVAGTLDRGRIRARDAAANAHSGAFQSVIFHLGPDRQGRMYPVEVTSIHRHRRPVAIIAAGDSATLALRWAYEGAGKPGTDRSKEPHTFAPCVRLRKGMVLLGSAWDSSAYLEFMAEVAVVRCAISLSSSGTAGMSLSPAAGRSRAPRPGLKAGHQVTVHCGSVCQNAQVISISKLDPSLDVRTLLAVTPADAGEVVADAAVPLHHNDRDACLLAGDRGLLRLRFCKEMEFLHVGSPVLCRFGEYLAVGRIVRGDRFDV